MRVRPRPWPLVVAALALVGVAQRIVILRGRWGFIDSDEAVVGLMARDVLDGEVEAFYWGQHYAGTLEPLLTALFGASRLALKLVPAGLAAVACVLLWRVARRFVPERTAQLTALLFWVAPGAYVWWSTKGRGFYWVTIVLGLVVLLGAQRIVEGRNRWRDGAMVGLAAGLGFWASPSILYFVVPAGVWLVARRKPPLRWLWAGLPAVAVGALPWLWHNVLDGFPSLERPVQEETVSFVGGIGRLLWQTLPISLNLRYPITFSWVADGIGAVAYVALGVALLACIVVRRRAPALVVLALAAFPLIYAWFPGAWFVGEGRYALFAAPFLALAIGWMVQRPTLMLATCVLAVGMSIGAIQHLGGQLPLHVGGDLRAMRAAGIEHAWAEYWIAYRLGFESGGWLSASPIAAQRDDELYDDVRRSTRPAFVFARDDARVGPLRQAIGPGATVLRTPNFDVVVAPRAVDPTTLPPGTAP